MISLSLSRRLKHAGLEWAPALHDFFAVPDRGMDNRVFVIGDMLANIERLLGSQVVAFQGSSEWALDYLVTTEAIWIPTEAQLRQMLQERLAGEAQPAVRLSSSPVSHRCEIAFQGERMSFDAGDGAEAYGQALLYVLENSPTSHRNEDEGSSNHADDAWARGIQGL